MIDKEEYYKILSIFYAYSISRKPKSLQKEYSRIIVASSNTNKNEIELNNSVPVKLQFDICQYDNDNDGDGYYEVIEPRFYDTTLHFSHSHSIFSIDLRKFPSYLLATKELVNMELSITVTWNYKDEKCSSFTNWYCNREPDYGMAEPYSLKASNIRLKCVPLDEILDFQVGQSNAYVGCAISIVDNTKITSTSYFIGDLNEAVVTKRVSCIICEDDIYGSLEELLEHFKALHSLLEVTVDDVNDDNISIRIKPVKRFNHLSKTLFETLRKGFHLEHPEVPKVEIDFSKFTGKSQKEVEAVSVAEQREKIDLLANPQSQKKVPSLPHSEDQSEAIATSVEGSNKYQLQRQLQHQHQPIDQSSPNLQTPISFKSTDKPEKDSRPTSEGTIPVSETLKRKGGPLESQIPPKQSQPSTSPEMRTPQPPTVTETQPSEPSLASSTNKSFTPIDSIPKVASVQRWFTNLGSSFERYMNSIANDQNLSLYYEEQNDDIEDDQTNHKHLYMDDDEEVKSFLIDIV